MITIFVWVDLNNPESSNPCFSPFLLLFLYQVKTFSNKIEVGCYREKLHVNHFWDLICTFFSHSLSGDSWFFSCGQTDRRHVFQVLV